MEPLFTNKSLFTKQNILEINQTTSSRTRWTGLSICMGILFIIGGILTGDYILYLFGIILGIFYPLFLWWTVRHSAFNKYQQLQQLHHGETETINSFFEDHFDVHDVQDGGNTTTAYTQVAKVYETKNLFFLMLSTRIGFMLEKKGFEGTTAGEFGPFIRSRAVGEGQIALKKKKRKTALFMVALLLVILAASIALSFWGDAIESMFPKTFSSGNYSIKLTSAFKVYDDEWESADVTVYYFRDTSEDLVESGSSFGTAAAYLQDTNDAYEVDSDVVAESDSRAWTAYTENYDGNEIFTLDYVIMSNGDFWYTEFYCLAKDADRYQPLFIKWAQTIEIKSDVH